MKYSLIENRYQDAFFNYGKNCTKVDIGNTARQLVPEEKFKAENWTDLGHKEFLKIDKTSEQLKLIEQMIKMARQKWTLEFSRFYEMIASSRDALYLTNNRSKAVIMAINWGGVFVVDAAENMLLSLRYMEIKSIELATSVRGGPIGIIIETVNGKSLQFNCTTSV